MMLSVVTRSRYITCAVDRHCVTPGWVFNVINFPTGPIFGELEQLWQEDIPDIINDQSCFDNQTNGQVTNGTSSCVHKTFDQMWKNYKCNITHTDK